MIRIELSARECEILDQRRNYIQSKNHSDKTERFLLYLWIEIIYKYILSKKEPCPIHKPGLMN